MKRTIILATGLWAAWATLQTPLCATVTITSMLPSVPSPQPLGSIIRWTVKATNSHTSPVMFQYNVAAGNNPYTVLRDFNIGTQSGLTHTAVPFYWATIAGEGIYSIKVVAKDFSTGETASRTINFTLTSRVTTGAPVANKTANPLVALFSAPACQAGSTFRAAFYTGSAPPTYTAWKNCNPPVSNNTYIAGMLPSTLYTVFSQTNTNGTIINGSTVPFTTGPLPTSLPGGNFLPSFTVTTPPGDTSNPLMLWSFTKVVVPVATDLTGHIIWFYSNPNSGTLVTRPVPGGTMLTIQNGLSWASRNTAQQMLREIDLAGNILRETNTGIISQQLVAMGATNGMPCGQVPQPPPLGTGCLDDFHHDAIRLPNGYTALLAHTEKLFPPGTQGNQGPDNVDILSEMVIVLDTNWQVTWYYDAFQQLNLARTAPLKETCGAGSSDCPSQLYLGNVANDWTHSNTIDYVASPTNPDSGDFLISVRNQDQIIRVRYNNGAGNCVAPSNCIVWYMGPKDNTNYSPSDFTFNNVSADSWPWFSHQHDVTYANGGANVFSNLPLLTIFDNGNTRCSPPPLGLGASGCFSRGMALEVDENAMTVTPALLQPLGIYTTALGSAEMLANNDYFFQTGVPSSQAIEIAPVIGVLGKQILNVTASSYSYRAWQMPSLYNPPAL